MSPRVQKDGSRWVGGVSFETRTVRACNAEINTNRSQRFRPAIVRVSTNFVVELLEVSMPCAWHLSPS